MFNYDETDLFHRCGYNKNVKDTNYFTGKYYTFCDGTTIPVTHNPIVISGLSNHIVLRTHLGYIPIENITKFSDIFDKNKYLNDDTEWILPYLLEQKEIYDKEVDKLSLTLGKHWKRHGNTEIIKIKKRVLTKNKE